MEILYDWLLRERSNGILEGKPKHAVDWRSINTDEEEARRNKVELIDSTILRGKAFIENLRPLPKPVDAVAIVSHNALINAIIIAVTPDTPYKELENTEVTELTIRLN